MTPRRALPMLVLVGLVLAAGGVSARTAGGEPTIAPGSFEEVDLRMDAGWSVDYDWSADRAVYFDIHSHRGAQVDYHVRNGSTNGTAGTFEAPDRGTYSLLWENRGDDAVTVSWDLEGRWIDPEAHFEDEEPTTAGPGLVAALAALGIAAAIWVGQRSW